MARSSSSLRSPLLPLLPLLLLWPAGRGFTEARTFEASPDGSPYSVASALAEAGPGDTVVLGDGTYDEAIITVQGGEEGRPLVITGSRDAVVNAGDNGKVVFVQHSWVTLEGFSIDGKISDKDEASSFVDKCVFVDSGNTGGDELLEGFSMQDLAVTNCGDECVRLKNFVVGADISNNVIENCGVRDFVYGNRGKNGEGIYVGTSSKQWVDGPDGCKDNTIRWNVITTNGNECVDIKEGAHNNVVEENTCKGQLDENSGCFGSRGDANTFRLNTASECSGVGVRIGGWEVDGYQYGRGNNVYGNTFTLAERGALSLNALPGDQGVICGNSCDEGPCGVVGGEAETGSDVDTTWDQPCDNISTTSSMVSAEAMGNGDDGQAESEPDQGAGSDEPDDDIAAANDDGEEGATETLPAVGSGDAMGQGGDKVTEAPGDDNAEGDCDAIPLLPSYLKASSTTQDGNPVTNIVDGNLSNRWSGEGTESWFTIELPEAQAMSGMQVWFEDGSERQQKFTTVCLGENQVVVHTDESAVSEEGVGQFFSFDNAAPVKTVMLVGHGNTVNDWNSINEIRLCRGRPESARKLVDIERGNAGQSATAVGPVSRTFAVSGTKTPLLSAGETTIRSLR